MAASTVGSWMISRSAMKHRMDMPEPIIMSMNLQSKRWYVVVASFWQATEQNAMPAHCEHP